MTPGLTFCGTGKSGLGHLRRLNSIAREMPDTPIRLLTNAPAEALERLDLAAFGAVEFAERKDMAVHCAEGPVVVDTAVLRGLERCDGPLCLILRETPAVLCERFRLQDRLWDLIICPNPPGVWAPPPGLAKRVEAVGWIYRPPPVRRVANAPPLLLIASGGGGTGETAEAFRRDVGEVLRRARALAPEGLEVVQALGPNASAAVPGVDRVVDPGDDLHQHFAETDLVISTAGYNSVLELAQTDTPTLLVGIARTYDDQSARVRDWGGRLGMAHDPAAPDRSAEWIAACLSARKKRAPVDLGPSGAAEAARLILGLMR